MGRPWDVTQHYPTSLAPTMSHALHKSSLALVRRPYPLERVSGIDGQRKSDRRCSFCGRYQSPCSRRKRTGRTLHDKRVVASTNLPAKPRMGSPARRDAYNVIDCLAHDAPRPGNIVVQFKNRTINAFAYLGTFCGYESGMGHRIVAQRDESKSRLGRSCRLEMLRHVQRGRRASSCKPR